MTTRQPALLGPALRGTRAVSALPTLGSPRPRMVTPRRRVGGAAWGPRRPTYFGCKGWLLSFSLVTGTVQLAGQTAGEPGESPRASVLSARPLGHQAAPQVPLRGILGWALRAASGVASGEARCLPVQLSGPGTPHRGVPCGAGEGVVCVLVIFSLLPPFSPTDPGWGGCASGQGGWARTPGSRAHGWQGGDREGSGWGDSPPLCPQWEEPGFVSLFCSFWVQGKAEASGVKTLGGEGSGVPASPTKAWTEVSGLMFN